MAANSLSFPSAGCPRRRSNITGLLRVILWTVLTCGATSFAQQAEVSLRLDVVAWGDEIGGLSFKSGEKAGNITALSFRYSEPVSYSGPAVMEIFKNGDGKTTPKDPPSKEDLEHELKPLLPEDMETSAGKDAPPKTGLALELEKRRKKAPNLVALASLPSGCRRATVLLAPAGDGTFIAYVIDDDPSKLPVGQLRVHNLSPHTVAMKCNGGAPREIKPRGSQVIETPDQQLTYELAYQLGDEWKFQEHNIIPIRAAEQTQMIILRSRNSFFLSADGSAGGFLQMVTLRRQAAGATPAP